ncbi:DUF1289 domain-containing protein [Stakelama sp. CBK3Z-3]|uniref:DUF1289 domain-containing protein n=1 Tax=Stakelama flava TaxID=2860338 RepID=A0ABS6XHY4_9SPHN|nr:DUF1289 domain-containing protein [Stakelama flava]MBW4329787.1 DUF1289 domain-containing protein [Stakelama flava]
MPRDEDDFVESVPPARVASPCIGVCRIDPDTDRCKGCRRTLDEITRWSTLRDDQRQAILDRLSERGG